MTRLYCILDQTGTMEKLALSWRVALRHFWAIPRDIGLDLLEPIARGYPLTHLIMFAPFYLAVKPIVTYVPDFSISFQLAVSTIETVWRGIGYLGRATRWRFRHDAPLLP